MLVSNGDSMVSWRRRTRRYFGRTSHGGRLKRAIEAAIGATVSSDQFDRTARGVRLIAVHLFVTGRSTRTCGTATPSAERRTDPFRTSIESKGDDGGARRPEIQSFRAAQTMRSDSRDRSDYLDPPRRNVRSAFNAAPLELQNPIGVPSNGERAVRPLQSLPSAPS
jgi:hypothetical protein